MITLLGRASICQGDWKGNSFVVLGRPLVQIYKIPESEREQKGHSDWFVVSRPMFRSNKSLVLGWLESDWSLPIQSNWTNWQMMVSELNCFTPGTEPPIAWVNRIVRIDRLNQKIRLRFFTWFYEWCCMVISSCQKKAVWQAVSTIRHIIVIEWYMRTSHSFMTQDGCTSSNFGKHLSRPVHHHQKDTWNSKADSRKWFGSWTSDNIIFFQLPAVHLRDVEP